MNEPTKRQQMVTEAIWKTITLAYTVPGDRSGNAVRIPIREVVSALATCIAQVLVDVEDARERQILLAFLAPTIDRAVQQSRFRSDVILPPESGIVLPN